MWSAPAGVHRGNHLREDAVLTPSKHEPRNAKDHSRETIEQGNRRSSDDDDRPQIWQKVSEKTRSSEIGGGAALGNEIPGDGMVNRPGEQQVKSARDDNRDSGCQR